MARDRLALILESMAANKELKSSHYKIYLCIFSGQQEGRVHNEKSLQEITGMHSRTVQKALKELLETGNIQKASDGSIYLNFKSGFPAIQKGESAAIGTVSPKSDQKSQSVLKQESYNEKHGPGNIEHKTSNEDPSSSDTRVKSSDPKNEDLNQTSKNKKKADKRFKILVDRLFEIYEKETKNKLNPLFGVADGKMIARLLKNLPEESVDVLCASFVNFLRTDDDFDALMITRGPVRYWATRVTAFLPKQKFDVVEGYKNRNRKNKNG